MTRYVIRSMSTVAPTFQGDQTAWFEKTVTSAVEGRRSALVELGPWLFNDWLAELPLAETLEGNDADLVTVYLLTPDAYSLPRLPYLLDLIKPLRTLIVLNEWGFTGKEAQTAFASILASPVVAAAQADGAGIVTMPHLDAAAGLDAIRAQRQKGADAMTNDPDVSAWLNRMEENFAPVADWLV